MMLQLYHVGNVREWKSVGWMRVIHSLSVVEHSWSCVTSLHETDVAQCTVHTQKMYVNIFLLQSSQSCYVQYVYTHLMFCCNLCQL